jgi:hypothetical protein
MDFTTILTGLVENSALAALAVVSLWMLKVSYEHRLEETKQRLEEERADKLMLNATLQDVACRMGEMTEVLRSLNNK